MRRRTAVLLALALAAASLAAADTSLVTETSNASADPDHYMNAFDAPTIAIGDFDGDGTAELVAHNDNQYVYVLSSTDARILAEFRPPYPGGWNVRPLNSPVVDDVDADGKLDIVVVTSAAQVCVYEFEPSTSTSSDFDFELEWCARMDAYDGGSAASDSPAWVEDVDGDGLAEIFANTEQVGYFAYRHDGSLLWSKGKTGGNAGPVVADVDGDGRKEVLYFGDAGEVRSLDARTGNVEWEKWSNSRVWPASIPVSGNVADLDGDGDMEVVYVARDAHDTDDYDNNRFMLFVRDGDDGDVVWTARPEWGNPMSYTHPVLHDLDGDGRKEILLQDWNTQGHKPGNWEKLGPANVFVYEHDGRLKWRTELDNTWSNDDLGLADVDGDGGLEVLAVGWGSAHDGVWYLDATTGAKERHVGAGEFQGDDWVVLRGPTVGDLDGDGLLEWAHSVHDSDFGGAIRVYATDAPCLVAYGGWQIEDPCDPPTGGDGGGVPPPPDDDTTFDASFADVSGNEWWVQVDVDANEPLAGVDARVDGGAWRALELKDWGDWAASFHVPDGSLVQFRARSTDGDGDLSDCYEWTEATPTSCDGATPPPPDDGFDATFSDPSGNDWWVQVDVDGNAPVAAVEAQADGGAWRDLEKKSWGAWAASFHVPDGTVVRFRATSSDGSEDLSGCYAWTEATPTTCPGDSGDAGDGTFAAEFHDVRGNEWWVETDVAANEPLAGVDARVDGGTWRALEKTSWGSWADSFHVPDGSSVEFRARSSDGDTDTSGTYLWPP